MAKKDLAGQINMFDVFRELEKSAEAAGEVEMVSLMPERVPVGETDVEIADKKAEHGEIKTESLNVDEETEHEKYEVGIEITDKVGTDEDAESVPEIGNAEEVELEVNDLKAESKAGDYIKENDTGIDKVSNEKIEEKFVNVDGIEIKNNSDITMHREKRDTDGNIVAEISYINYNKVLIRRKGHEDILKSFDNSYDAVDYYVSNMRLDNF